MFDRLVIIVLSCDSWGDPCHQSLNSLGCSMIEIKPYLLRKLFSFEGPWSSFRRYSSVCGLCPLWHIFLKSNLLEKSC